MGDPKDSPGMHRTLSLQDILAQPLKEAALILVIFE